MFIIIAGAAVFGWLHGDVKHAGIPDSASDFSQKWRGFWSSLIYAFYAYGGIEVIGLMAMRLKKKEDAPKAGIIMLMVLVVIYVLSFGLAVYMAAHGAFHEKESPFVTALRSISFCIFSTCI